MEKNSNTTTWLERLSRFGPLVFWIVVILGLGSSMGSMNETSRFIRPLLEFLFPNALPETLSYYHGLIRKAAHFTEYFVLGILAIRVFAPARRINGFLRAAILSLLLCSGIAALDEYQQSFNPARTSSPIDALIDIAGAATAIGLSTWILHRRRTSAKTIEP